MAATTEVQKPDAQHYVDYEEYVDFQLEKTRSSIKFTDIFTTLTTLAVVVITYLLIFVVLDQWVFEGGFGYSARVGLLSVLMGGVLGTLAWRVILPLMRRIHPLYAARVIEKSDPNLKSNLVNFVDVRQSNMQSAPVVLKAMEKRAAVELSHIDVEEAVDRRPLLRIAYALLGVVVICALYILFSPKDPFASVRRALLPTAAIEVATETTISDVEPKDKEVPAGTVQKVTADVRGKDADSVQILFTTADHKYVNQPVEMKRDEATLPRYSGVLNGENGRGLLQSLTYRIVAGDARTKDYSITVVQSPSARLDEVQYEYPPYMELQTRTTAEGHIDGWEGSTVTVHATANMPVRSARIVLTDVEDAAAKGEEITMQVTDGTNLSATWKLEFRSDGTSARFYHIDVKTPTDQTDRDPTHYTFRIRPDQKPEVALLAPTRDLGLPPAPPVPANGIIPLIIHAADPDFQLRSITLKATRGSDVVLDKKLFEDRLPAPNIQGEHDFRLSEISRLTDGETIQFWIEAKDNKQPTANRANTTPINVRIGLPVSAKEVQEQLAEEKKRQDQLAQTEGQQNPPRPDNPPPPKPGDNSKPEKSRPRGEKPDPENRPKTGNPEPEKDPNNLQGKSDHAKEGGGRKRPATDQEALQRLAQQENKNKPDDQEQEPEQKQAGDETKSADKNSNRANQDQRADDEEKTPGAAPKNADHTGRDPANPSDNGPEKEKPKPGDRSNEKPHGAGENSQTKSDQAKGDQARTDKKDTQRQDQSGGSPKSAQSKTQPNKDQAKNDADNSDKPNDVKKPGTGKQPGKDGNSGDETIAPKKDDTGKRKTGQGDAAQNDPAKNDSRTNDPSKTENSEPGADPGKNKESGKAGSQPDGKDGDDDPSKTGKPGADPKQSAGDDEPAAAEPKNKSPGGAGKQEEKPDAGADSKDPSAPRGTAGESDNEQEDRQPGPGKGKPSKKTVEGPAKPSRKDGPTGEEEPAQASNDSVKKQATGDENGKGVGDDDDDPRAPKAKNDIQREEGTKPGKKKTSTTSPDPQAKKADKQRTPDDGTSGSSPDPDHADRPPSTKDDTDPKGKVDDEDADSTPNGKKPNPGDKRPDNPPRTANEDLQGRGRPDGQRSKRPQGGEEGSSAPNQKGKSGANQTGPGDETDEPGETDPSKEKTGVTGKQKGPGTKTRPTDQEGQPDSSPGGESGNQPSPKSATGKPGKKPGQSGEPGQPGENSDQAGNEPSNGPDGKPNEGQTGAKPGENGGKPGGGQKPGSKSSDGKTAGKSSQPGKPGSNTGSAKSGGGITAPPGEGDGTADGNGGPSDARSREGADDDEPPTPEQEEANLEYARKATNLVLNRLKDQLRRGDVDQKLLDELGWNDQKDIERLVKFLEQGLNPRDDDMSPEAINRRQQFEETLKSLNLGNETGSRTGNAGTSRQTRQNAVRSIPVPPEYRKLYESYTRSMSKNADPSAEKANPGKATKKAAK